MAAFYRNEMRHVGGVEISETLTVKDNGKCDYTRRENGAAVVTQTDVALSAVTPVLFEKPAP